MKKLCIATYVYGDTYQNFIPIYIYSILKNYPNYDVRIYLDRKLRNSIQSQLTLVESMGNFEIIENYDQIIDLSRKASKISQVQRSIRWLFFDTVFENYEAIYIGDIDIFICKEDIEIFEQHSGHCDFLNLPYSNWVRTRKLNKKANLKNILKIIKKYGFKEMLKYYKNSVTEIKRLSGLHFVKTKDYYSIINELTSDYFMELERLVLKKSNKWNLVMFNNEHLLYDLISNSRLNIPEETEASHHINITQNYNQIAFRPHHGIHLGIFRSNTIKDKIILDTISSTVYIDYYNQFCDLRKNDVVFKKLETHFDDYIKALIQRMDLFYSKIIK